MKQRHALRNYAEYTAARFVLFTLGRLPLGASRRLASFYARMLDRALPRLRRVAEQNLHMALPDAAPGPIIDGVFESIGRILLTIARFPQLNRQTIGEWIRYEGYEHFEEALASGRGVLFATAHLGNWELSAFAHALLSAPMHVVVRPFDNPLIDRLVTRRRTLSGNTIIEKKEYARGILKALAANEAVGILIDQNASAAEGVFVDFFGVPACAGAGFARIAAKSGAAVIPGFAIWSDAEQKYVLRFLPPTPITGDAEADTRRLQAELEKVIRLHPEQWLWIHRRWKTRPEGKPPIY